MSKIDAKLAALKGGLSVSTPSAVFSPPGDLGSAGAGTAPRDAPAKVSLN